MHSRGRMCSSPFYIFNPLELIGTWKPRTSIPKGGTRERNKMAGEEGFEPSLTDSESAVLPLDDSPSHQNYST